MLPAEGIPGLHGDIAAEDAACGQRDVTGDFAAHGRLVALHIPVGPLLPNFCNRRPVCLHTGGGAVQIIVLHIAEHHAAEGHIRPAVADRVPVKQVLQLASGIQTADD